MKDYYALLDYILDRIGEVFSGSLQINEYVKKNNFTDLEKKEAYIELVEEGFIRELSQSTSASDDYEITFKGYLFIQDGKYRQKRINEKAASDAAEALMRRTERNEVRLVAWTRNLFWGTLGIVVATLLLFLVELMNRLDGHH